MLWLFVHLFMIEPWYKLRKRVELKRVLGQGYEPPRNGREVFAKQTRYKSKHKTNQRSIHNSWTKRT